MRRHAVSRAVRRHEFDVQVIELLEESDVIRIGCPVQRDPHGLQIGRHFVQALFGEFEFKSGRWAMFDRRQF